MKYPDAQNWPVRDMMAAMGAFTELGELIAHHAMLALMAGEPVFDYSNKDDEHWQAIAQEKRDEMPPEDFEHLSQAMELVLEIGLDLLTSYQSSFRKAGMIPNPLPDPSSVEIPDLADDIDW